MKFLYNTLFHAALTILLQLRKNFKTGKPCDNIHRLEHLQEHFHDPIAKQDICKVKNMNELTAVSQVDRSLRFEKRMR